MNIKEKQSKISLVIPTLNEEKNIEKILSDIESSDIKIDEIIIVDGYSKDNTVKIAKKYGAKIIYDTEDGSRGGKGLALRRGMNTAKGDIVINMDADCSNLPSELVLLIAGIKAGYDVCMGSRFLQGGGTEDMPFHRKFGNKLFVFWVNLLWGMQYSDLAYGFRAFKKDVINDLNLNSDGFGIETEMSIKCAKRNLKVLEVPSYEKTRMYGEGNLKTIKDGWEIFKVIMKEVFIR